VIPNNYRLVREAIDRGVPLEEVKAGNNVTGTLKRIIFGPSATPAAKPGRVSGAKGRAVQWAR
jgi:pilus assembly protein CpaE